MFANTQASAMHMAMPDVCNTPVGTAVVPTPYPNIAMTSTAIPTIYNMYIQAMPDHNLLTEVPISSGDEAGVSLGVASGLIIGPVSHLLGSTKVFKSGAPATMMLCTTGQNGASPNAVGMTLSPSQVKVMILC